MVGASIRGRGRPLKRVKQPPGNLSTYQRGTEFRLDGRSEDGRPFLARALRIFKVHPTSSDNEFSWDDGVGEVQPMGF